MNNIKIILQNVFQTGGGGSSGGSGGSPTGPAGGDLTGDYPNPTIKASVNLTGTPTLSATPALNSNNLSIATTEYVDRLGLTIGTGLTNTTGTLTVNLSTGVAGGQSVIGGTAAGNSLTISSTAHATKGSLIFGASSYNEANNTFSYVLGAPGSIFSGAWTGTAASQGHLNSTVTITGRSNANGGNADDYNHLFLNPTFVVGTSSTAQVMRGQYITGTFPGSLVKASAFSINPTMSGASATYYLIEAQAAGTDRFKVAYNGNMFASGVSHTLTATTSSVFNTPLVNISTAGANTDLTLTNLSGGGLVYRLRSANAGVFTLNNGTTDLLSFFSNGRYLYTAQTLTAQTASTEITDYYINQTSNLQFATGAISTLRGTRITPRTYSFVGSSTITDAYSFFVDSAPIAGTNATITNRYAAGFGGNVAVTGNLSLTAIGNGIQIKTGSNASAGTATLVGGTVTVSNTTITANTMVKAFSQSDGGTPGFLRCTAKTNGTSFVITSSSASDTSVIYWELVELIP